MRRIPAVPAISPARHLYILGGKFAPVVVDNEQAQPSRLKQLSELAYPRELRTVLGARDH